MVKVNCESEGVPGGSKTLYLSGRNCPQVKRVQVVRSIPPLRAPAAPRQQTEGARLPLPRRVCSPRSFASNLAPSRPLAPASASRENAGHPSPGRRRSSRASACSGRPPGPGKPLPARSASATGASAFWRGDSRAPRTPHTPAALGLEDAVLNLGFYGMILNPIWREKIVNC